MKRVVVGVGLLLGFSGFASADDSSNWFNRHNLPFHKTAKGHPRPGGPSLGSQGTSGGNGSGQSVSGGSNSNGNNSGGNSGGSSFGNFVGSFVGENTTPGGGKSGGSGKIAAPEIDPASSASALGLLSAALLMIRGRRKKHDAPLAS
jgi:hypothetical protein